MFSNRFVTRMSGGVLLGREREKKTINLEKIGDPRATHINFEGRKAREEGEVKN